MLNYRRTIDWVAAALMLTTIEYKLGIKHTLKVLQEKIIVNFTVY